MKSKDIWRGIIEFKSSNNFRSNISRSFAFLTKYLHIHQILHKIYVFLTTLSITHEIKGYLKKKLKRNYWIHAKQQFSFKCFSKFCFVNKTFAYLNIHQILLKIYVYLTTLSLTHEIKKYLKNIWRGILKFTWSKTFSQIFLSVNKIFAYTSDPALDIF